MLPSVVRVEQLAELVAGESSVVNALSVWGMPALAA
jgi:hypothetical protein